MANKIVISPSSFADVMSKGRGKGEAYGQTFYSRAAKISRQYLGVQEDNLVTWEMQHGIDNEPFAIVEYERVTGSHVVPCLLRVQHPDYDFVTGEPDGFVNNNGLIEVKCPNQANHYRNLIGGEQVKDYYPQMQGYMWITGRQWCDFVSYDPRYPDGLKLAVTRVERDNEFIAELETRVLFMHQTVNEIIETLKTKMTK